MSMKQENNTIDLIELAVKSLFFGVLVFCTSYLITDINHMNGKELNVEKKIQNQPKTKEYYSNINTETPQVKKSVNISEPYYIIFKNADPSIKQIEVFLANNQHKLSEEELMAIEQLRKKKITELMARKYVQLTSEN